MHRKATDKGVSFYVSRDKATGQLTGMAYFANIYLEQRASGGGMWIIPSKIGKGISWEYAYMLVQHSLEVQGNERHEHNIYKTNKTSIKVHTRFGMKYEGLSRQELIRKGRNRDLVYLSFLRDNTGRKDRPEHWQTLFEKALRLPAKL